MLKRILAICAVLAVFSGGYFAGQNNVSRRVREATQSASLLRMYDAYNQTYFDGKLTNNVTIVYDDLSGDIAQAICTRDVKVCTIKIDRATNVADRVADMSLLHEMVHIELHMETQPQRDANEDDHTPHWYARMRQLAAAGAFDDLW